MAPDNLSNFNLRGPDFRFSELFNVAGTTVLQLICLGFGAFLFPLFCRRNERCVRFCAFNCVASWGLDCSRPAIFCLIKSSCGVSRGRRKIKGQGCLNTYSQSLWDNFAQFFYTSIFVLESIRKLGFGERFFRAFHSDQLQFSCRYASARRLGYDRQ